MTEYIIQVNENKYGWCLERLAGTDKARAEKILAEVQSANPKGEYRLHEVESKNAWWNDPFLAN